MKNCTLFFIYLLLVSLKCIAQPVNNQIKDVSMPSPAAASLGKYGDIPIGYYTGVPNITIPIHTITDGPLSLPISLNYHASGMKVGEPASWAGLGWSLHAGGAISRTIQGKADESCDGYFMSGKHINVSETYVTDVNDATKHDTLLCVEPTGPYTYAGLQNGTVDSEPDLFSFSVGDYSGKFFIEADLTDDNIVNGKVILVPKQDLKITYETSGSCGTLKLRRFTILTPDGTRYEFGNIDNDPTSKGLDIQQFDENLFPTVSSWHLRKISTPDGNYAIHLNYVQEKYRYQYRASSGIFHPFGPPYPTVSPSGNYSYHVIDHLGWRLSAITTTGNISTVSFLAGAAAREDLDISLWNVGNNPEPAKPLAGIRIEAGSLSRQFDLTYSYYVDASSDKSGTSADKRLKLTGLQERSLDNVILARPYTFQYYEQAGNTSFLPNRLSASVDHWGFYNGASNPHSGLNIPVTKLAPYVAGGLTVYPIKGTSDRETNEEKMKWGTISKLIYPTGGSTSFEFEANTYYGTLESYTYNNVAELKRPPGGDVCVNDIVPVQTVTFPAMTAVEINNLYYIWINQAPPAFPATCQQATPEVTVQLYVNGSNQVTLSVGSSVSNAPGTVSSSQGKLQDLFQNKIPVGVPVAFKIQGINITSSFIFKKLTVTSNTKNHLVGGLRIKKTISNNGTAGGPDVVRSYSYDKSVISGQSSGILYNKPVYGYVFQSCLGGCMLAQRKIVACPNPANFYRFDFFFETSVVPLASLEGYHIGYSAVREYFDGTASGYYNLYQYYNEAEDPFNGLPITPSPPRIGAGEMESKAQRTSTNEDIAYDIYDKKPEASQGGLGTYIKWNTYRVSGEPGGNAITFWRKYPLVTRPFRYQTITTFRDGQLTISSRKYEGAAHLQLTKETITNSDGKATVTEYKYPADLAASLPATQAAKFVELNILVPLETTVKVSNVLLKGSKREYAFFDNVSGNFTGSTSSPGTFIRPSKFYDYEVTYNAAGVLQAGSYVLKGTIDNYHGTASATGRAGMPKQFTKVGWLPETYEWYPTGLIKKRTFKNFNWTYEYLDGKNLLSKVTNPDGQFTEYVYDGLMRLKEIKSRNGNVKTVYDYTYPTLNAGIISTFGNIKSTQTYTAIPGSGLATQETFQYFDGLGRGIATIYKGKANAGKDQVQALTYDNQGRVSKTYEVYGSAGSTGAFVSTPANADHQLTEYEANSLNRVWKQTPAGWSATTTTYGTNTAADGVQNISFINGSTSAFDAGSLSKTTVADGNGNKTITFKDKKGRMVLSRRTNGNEASKSDTYYVYDDKDRLVRVIPPGATYDDSELVFTYQYKGNDLISQKKVPGKGYEAFEYNSRDLPVKYQDPILRANSNRWMGSKYDDYGRLTHKGVYASGTGDGIVLSNTIIENSYGINGVEIDKLKMSKAMVFATPDPVANLGTGLGTLQKTFGYDNYGRLSGFSGNNHTLLANNAAENVAYQYDFGDNILSETRNSNSNGGSAAILNNRQFDAWGRLLQTTQGINGAAATTISRFSYTNKDEIAWKKLGPGAGGLQQVDYKYHQSGLLENINGTAELTNSNLATANMLLNLGLPTFATNTTEDLFRLKLEYQSLTPNLGGTIQSNGNIGQMLWQVKGRTTQAYGFTYDYLDRLTNAKYTSFNANASVDPVDYFGESQIYDARGNILSITRKGMVLGAGKYSNQLIDKQTITIPTGSNQAIQSSGTNNINPTKINLNAPHNHLNLPVKWDFGGNNNIEFWYDGLGNKLRKIVKTNNAVTLTQDYLGGIEVKNGAIEAIYNEEGRAYKTGGAFRYEYVLRDHLGNTRLSFTDKNANGIIDSHAEILQENHYYPFGKSMEGAWYKDAAASRYPYLYNGKELTEEFGLNFYDYGTRWLDPGMGSWWEVDPLSEVSRRWSPYAYGNNNPVRFTDPDGRMTEDEVMQWYRSQELSNFGDQASGILGSSTNYGASETNHQDNVSNQTQSEQKPNETLTSESGQDPYDFHDPINDPLIGVKAMTGLYEISGLSALYQGIREGLITTVRWAAKKAGYKAAARSNAELFRFTGTASKHMIDANRMIPVQTIDDIIKAPIAVAKDPQGTKALMYYSQMWKNEKLYNVEILYDKSVNTIMHFKYSRESMGPLLAIPK